MPDLRPTARRIARDTLGFALLCLGVTVPLTPAYSAPTELEVIEHTSGDGAEVRRGWFATIRYAGWLYDEKAADKKGAQFINSDDKGRPVTFVYGYKRALPGMEQGMEGMKVGARRTLKPSSAAATPPGSAGPRACRPRLRPCAPPARR